MTNAPYHDSEVHHKSFQLPLIKHLHITASSIFRMFEFLGYMTVFFYCLSDAACSEAGRYAERMRFCVPAKIVIFLTDQMSAIKYRYSCLIRIDKTMSNNGISFEFCTSPVIQV